MRRIELKHCRCGVRGGRSVTSMSTANYRLMRAVVRAAECEIRDFPNRVSTNLRREFSAFNAPEKRK